MKGMLYSIIAALLVIPITTLILFNLQLIEKNVDMNIRANELEYFSSSVEEDLNRFLSIASKRALISAVSKVITEGVPLVDTQSNLTEMIVNGTLDGVIAPLIDDNNLNAWETDVTNIARDSGFEISFHDIDVNITQNDSFSVLFETTVFFNISDKNANMGVARDLVSKTAVSVNNIEDPLFPLQTYGNVIRIIRVSNFSNLAKSLVQGTLASGSISGNATHSASSPSIQKVFVTNSMTQDISVLNQFGGIVSEDTYVPTGLSRPYIVGATGALSLISDSERVYLDSQTKKVWNLQNLTLFVRDKYYKASVDGPSFLDRLEGRLNLSDKYKYGLETTIHQDDLQTLEGAEIYQLVHEQASRIDYVYWGNALGNSVRNGNYDPVFSWLKIDTSHANIYGVNELII